MTTTFIDFPEITSFHNVVQLAKKWAIDYPNLVRDPIRYRGKIKLHGTCSGVRLEPSCPETPEFVRPMSRTQFISSEKSKDNMGFARWVESASDYWKALATVQPMTTIVFGEWAGQGIQSGTAIQQIGEKIFAVFAILRGDDIEKASFIVEPDEIRLILSSPSIPLPSCVRILPWYGEPVVVDFKDHASLISIVDRLNAEVAKVEPLDPWVKETFDKDGICEGIVYYPYWDDKLGTRHNFSNFAFKAKGEKHKVNKTKEAVQLAPEVVKSIEEFVAMFVTGPRLEQGLTAIGGVLDMKFTGAFLKWMMSDISKESKAELEAANLTWEQVNSFAQTAARTWYINKAKAI